MKVKLVSFTVPCIDELPLDSDVLDLIAYCARVSNPSNQLNTETSEKLINYLIKHKHFSPFEMANACLEIETTRDIARQILRHRSFTFQEFSQRYADPTEDLSFIYREARLQDIKNRQNSIEVIDEDLQRKWLATQQTVAELALDSYKWAIKHGIAKEVARAVLPEGLTMSRMYVNGTIRSWIHYLEVRTDPSTQKEHREVAVACAKAIAEIFPMIQNSVHPDA
jgi:thymidylate synthase (FAD)